MTWDADSNRVSFTSSTGGTTEFMYDITAGIPAVIKETGSTYPKTYLREPDGSLVAMFISSYPYYYHFDALGSTRMLTDESGHITDTYTYDAWGNASHTYGGTSQPYQYVGQLGYYTHYQDANLPLLQLGVRFYDPQTGRFGQVDAVGNPTNGSNYAYVLDNPVRCLDPSGLFWCERIPKFPWIRCHRGPRPEPAPQPAPTPPPAPAPRPAPAPQPAPTPPPPTTCSMTPGFGPLETITYESCILFALRAGVSESAAEILCSGVAGLDCEAWLLVCANTPGYVERNNCFAAWAVACGNGQ